MHQVIMLICIEGKEFPLNSTSLASAILRDAESPHLKIPSLAMCCLACGYIFRNLFPMGESFDDSSRIFKEYSLTWSPVFKKGTEYAKDVTRALKMKYPEQGTEGSRPENSAARRFRSFDLRMSFPRYIVEIVTDCHPILSLLSCLLAAFL
jgi:hypothetical protein